VWFDRVLKTTAVDYHLHCSPKAVDTRQVLRYPLRNRSIVTQPWAAATALWDGRSTENRVTRMFVVMDLNRLAVLLECTFRSIDFGSAQILNF